ncbi:MAG TPA: VWA domain-containing protein [Terriglobales bacterium]|jgi:VWFA-related protein
MSGNPLRIAVCLLLCVALNAAPLPQQATPEELTIPSVRVNTRLVLVSAIVTDKSGQRVRDLKQNDFAVFENGKPQKISAFQFESRGFEAAPKAAPALPQNVYTNRPEYNMPQGPLTVILLDGINTAVADQASARRQVLKYLGTQLQPGQRVSVYTLVNSLNLMQDFTDDVTLLKTAVEKFTPQKSLEIQQEEVEQALPNIRITGDTGVRGAQGSAARLLLVRMSEFLNEQVKFAIDERAQRTQAALRLLSRRLAGYPGRKNLVWVSAGFPIEITSQVVQLTTDADVLAQGATNAAPQERVDKSYEDDLHQLAAELTDAQVSVYSVDAHGLVGSTLADASSQGTNAAGLLRTGAEFGATVARSGIALQRTQDTLLTLSTESGGRLFKNSNDISGAVATSVADGSSYYLLAYYPENKNWDGKFRKIQVKLDKPGLEVRHRSGYFARDAVQWAKNKDKSRDGELAASMSLGAPSETMVIFDARVLPPEPSSKMKVPVEFLVNPTTIAGEQMKDGGLHYVIEFHVAAYSSEGKLVVHKDTAMDAPVKADRLQAFMQQGIPFRTDLDLGPGRYRLRLAVRDGRTGYSGTTEIPLVLGGK